MINKVFKSKYCIIAVGAILGSFIRWQIDNIFWINIVGCFLLGFINKIKIQKNFKLLFGFSFTGSLTTFSSWMLELFLYLKKNLYITFLKEIMICLIAGFISVSLGSYLGSLLNFKKNLKIN